jgi:O-antigen ligase
MGIFVLLAWLFIAWRLIRRDIALRDGVSSAIWIPTLWAFILLSRPLSTWLGGFGAGEDSLEGSPTDRLFYFGLMVMSIMVLVRRRVIWSQVIAQNWPILLFYFFLLASTTWAPASFVSFKRWVKDFANIFVALVIITEVNPQQAFRAVFVRSAYVLLPLSIIFLRWFPELGRRYLRGGQMEVVGVTDQKNSLGILVVVCGLILLWDFLERTPKISASLSRFQRYLPVGFVAIGAYLLYLCNSVTSILALALGSLILLTPKLPLLRQRANQIGFGVLLAMGGFFLLDSLFGIKGIFLRALGRDESLTGRTDVWRELLGLRTDPIFGTGFCSIWSDNRLLEQLPDWVGKSAHNGYLEMYIDGGFIALALLALALLFIARRLNRELALGGYYPLFRLAIFTTAVIGNISESHWARMGPLWFAFLTVTFHTLVGERIHAREVQRTEPSPDPVTQGVPS